MTITSVSDYNVLLTNLSYSLTDKASDLSKKYVQGTVNIYDKLRFLLLTRYIKKLNDEAVFELYDDTMEYIIGDFVKDASDNFYVCLKDFPSNPSGTPSGILLTDTDYWNTHLQFTYDYTSIDIALQQINRICGTNYSI